MKTAIPLFALLTGLSSTLPAAAQQAPAGKQDPVAVRQVVEHFLRTQTAGLPGQVNISVNNLDPRSNLASCAAPEAFLPGGSRAWGKTTVGVRCAVPVNWTIYISATVQVIGEYLTAATPLTQGQLVGPKDVVKARGDLSLLPPAILTDVSQAVGRTVAMPIAAGAPLRQDVLRSQHAVLQGQTVKLISSGPGFRVSAEGRALNNASEGQVIQARIASGQVITGVAKMGGVIEVTY